MLNTFPTQSVTPYPKPLYKDILNLLSSSFVTLVQETFITYIFSYKNMRFVLFRDDLNYMKLRGVCVCVCVCVCG